jgi:hypothetical protein
MFSPSTNLLEPLFCSVRGCIAGHLGFLVGLGRCYGSDPWEYERLPDTFSDTGFG